MTTHYRLDGVEVKRCDIAHGNGKCWSCNGSGFIGGEPAFEVRRASSPYWAKFWYWIAANENLASAGRDPGRRKATPELCVAAAVAALG